MKAKANMPAVALAIAISSIICNMPGQGLSPLINPHNPNHRIPASNDNTLQRTHNDQHSATISERTNEPTRRTFFSQVVKNAAIISSTSMALHDTNCGCRRCTSFIPESFFGIEPAMAYERDVGGKDASPETKSQNEQAKLTNARLEASGFKLDTKEEEEKRLSDGLASFSYDSVTNSKTKGSPGKGYGARATTLN